MKYILFAFIMAITVSFTTNGCTNEVLSVSSATDGPIANYSDSPTRAEQIVCNLNTQTRTGKVKDWVPMNSLVTDKRYYRLSMQNGSITSKETYTTFYINMSAGNSTSIDINNDCAKELYKYLEIVKGFNIEDEKQKVVLDFLENAERQFGAQPEEEQ